ncbi:uncharacterized protein [Odocoileus virginianus]|uniref:Uncharacterized protein n=1 Tax=Odocoileus virginianus TaxID=9874 RepID=A0ABM4J895_ODOVR
MPLGSPPDESAASIRDKRNRSLFSASLTSLTICFHTSLPNNGVSGGPPAPPLPSPSGSTHLNEAGKGAGSRCWRCDRSHPGSQPSIPSRRPRGYSGIFSSVPCAVWTHHNQSTPLRILTLESDGESSYETSHLTGAAEEHVTAWGGGVATTWRDSVERTPWGYPQLHLPQRPTTSSYRQSSKFLVHGCHFTLNEWGFCSLNGPSSDHSRRLNYFLCGEYSKLFAFKAAKRKIVKVK